MHSVTWLRVAGMTGLLIGAGLLLPAWSEAPRGKDVTPVSQEKDKDKDKEKPRTVEQIMEAIHGEGGLRTQIAKAARTNKLGDAQKPMEEWVKLAGQLSDAKPPRGSAESWKKYSATYEKQVKSMAAVVKTEKQQAVRDALNSIARGCNACHNAHKAP